MLSIWMIYRSKSGKKSCGKLRQSLFSSSPPGPDASTSSLGYHSDSLEGEETDEEEGAEVIEDLAALEDEGVMGLSRSKYKVHVALGVCIEARAGVHLERKKFKEGNSKLSQCHKLGNGLITPSHNSYNVPSMLILVTKLLLRGDV